MNLLPTITRKEMQELCDRLGANGQARSLILNPEGITLELVVFDKQGQLVVNGDEVVTAYTDIPYALVPVKEDA